MDPQITMSAFTTGRMRFRELGISIGRLPTGPNNAITDVAGVMVGHSTLVIGEGPLVVGQGPVRTGVTVILPSIMIGDGEAGHDAVFAGYHVLNGAGEMTGVAWIVESGLLTNPSHSQTLTASASFGTPW